MIDQNQFAGEMRRLGESSRLITEILTEPSTLRKMGVLPFEEFSTELSSRRKRGSVLRSDLLQDLYRLALEKAVKEQCATLNRSAVLGLRLKRRQMSKVRARFSDAARNLEEACKFCGVEIEVKEGDRRVLLEPSKPLSIDVANEKKNGPEAQASGSPIDSHAAFPAVPVSFLGKMQEAARMARHLRNSVEEAIFREQIIAAKIPQSQRIGVEKRLASEYCSRFFNGDDPVPPQPGPKATAIDRWFVGAAASYLDRYQISQGSQIRIIARLFKAAFRDTSRSEESVRKLLRRQKKRGGGPECQVTSPIAGFIVESSTADWLHGARIVRWEECARLEKSA